MTPEFLKNIIGANLLASDIILNTQGNLLVKSKQNLLCPSLQNCRHFSGDFLGDYS